MLKIYLHSSLYTHTLKHTDIIALSVGVYCVELHMEARLGTRVCSAVTSVSWQT
jgi:hypothetical protein